MDESLKEARWSDGEGWRSEDARRAFAAARRFAVARWAEAACALLLLLMSVSLLAATARKTITIDEVVLIPAAYYHFVAGDFHLVHEHPPLCKIVAGIPLLFVQPNEIPRESVDKATAAAARKWIYQDHFWTSNRAAFERVAYWPRAAMVVLTIALGVLVFAFARELFGPRAAVLAVLLYTVEPTVLAHGRVVQTDVPAAFGYLAVAYALYRYLGAPSWRRAAWLGAACGVALLSKFSMLIIAPLLLAVFAVLLWRAARPGGGEGWAFIPHAAVVALVTLLVIQAAYYFHSRALDAEDYRWIGAAFPSYAVVVARTVRALSYVLPTDYVLGVFWQLWHSREGHAAGLLGMYRQTGWWYYFPVAFALKTTLPFLLLSLAALAWGGYRLLKKRDARFLILLVPFVVYTAFVMMSPINIGVRYYIPAYTFLFIAGGALLDALLRRGGGRARLAGAAVAVVLVGWMAFEALRAYPDYMAYMNQLASRQERWWYLSDSNVEWGDDVKELAAYLRARGETRARAAVLGGFLTLNFHGVEQVDLLAPPAGELPRTRYTAIGASFLNGSTVPVREAGGVPLSEEQRVNYFDAYRRRAPEKIFGGSIYLYREYE